MNGMLALELGAAVVGGAIFWTFAEYALHNWYGHWPKGKTWFSREHLRHHTDPKYFASAWDKARAALITMVWLTPLAMLSFGLLRGGVFAASFILMYLAYEYMHWRVHNLAPRGRTMRRLYVHHLSHHFGSPKTNHGVTTTLWDSVFRTYSEPTRMAVPLDQAPRWLVDAAGELVPEYAAEFKLTAPVKRAEPALAPV